MSIRSDRRHVTKTYDKSKLTSGIGSVFIVCGIIVYRMTSLLK